MEWGTLQWQEPLLDGQVMRVALRRKVEVDDRVLYPADDGIPMEDTKHTTNAVVLQTTLTNHLKSVGRDAFVAVNNFIYYRRGDQKACVGPDFYVILGAKEDPERDCWRAWHEDPALLPPQVVVEFVSKSSGYKDRVKKFAIYRDVLRVPNYVICNNRRYRLDAYALRGDEYVAVPADALGRVACDAIGLSLGFHEGMLRWFMPDGTLIPTDGEHLAQAQAELTRLKQLLKGRS
ncbi:MAG: Uma2 family endonuclease [Armatimonadetes bacterium]|nr:Uma2 family endonuclease [Armatimonadota bacterium]